MVTINNYVLKVYTTIRVDYICMVYIVYKMYIVNRRKKGLQIIYPNVYILIALGNYWKWMVTFSVSDVDILQQTI